MTPGGQIQLRQARIAGATAFGSQGLLFAVLLTHLPAFKDRYGIGDGTVTAIILLVTLLAGAGSVAAGALAARAGSGRTLIGALTVLGVAAGSTSLDAGLPVFVAAFAVYGVGLGAVDAASNMQAVAVEHLYGRSVLTSFHAVWSAAGIAGALWTWASGQLDVPLGPAIIAPALMVLAVSAWAAPRLLTTEEQNSAGQQSSAGQQEGAGVQSAAGQPERAPTGRVVLAIGAAMACFYAADSGIGNWSTIYLHDVLGATDSVAALGYAGYQAASLLTRIGGDQLVRRWGATPVVMAGAALGSVGLLAAVLAHAPPLAIVGFTAAGLGLAVVAPLCFAAVGALAPGAADAMIAKVNIFNYAGAICGGVVVGAIGTVSSLRIGFLAALAAAVVLLALAPAFSPRGVLDRSKSSLAGQARPPQGRP